MCNPYYAILYYYTLLHYIQQYNVDEHFSVVINDYYRYADVRRIVPLYVMGNVTLEFVPMKNIGDCALTVDLFDSFGDGWNGYDLLVEGGGYESRHLRPSKFLDPNSNKVRKSKFLIPLKLGYAISFSVAYGGSISAKLSSERIREWMPREYWEVRVISGSVNDK